MVIGNAILLFIGAQLIQSDRHLSGLDIAYWLVVLLVVSARFVDIKYFAGTDEYGTPASLRHARRFAIKVVSVAGILWLVIHLVIEIRR